MAFTLVGFGFSAYLTYRELFSIHAICEWCASSAVIMTVMMFLSVWRFLRSDPAGLDLPAAPADGAGGAVDEASSPTTGEAPDPGAQLGASSV